MAIVIKYWPILARGRGLFQMCIETDQAFEHHTDMKEFGAALFGAETTNLAPPIIIDGDVTVSQSTATHVYLGKKLGFTVGIDTPGAEARALQYMQDLNDMHTEMTKAAFASKTDVKDIQEYLTGKRYKQHLEAIDRSIVGPFYFGAEPSYVDFYADGVVTMCEGKFLGPLLAKSGDTLSMHAPKLVAAVAAIRARPAASKLPDVPPVPASLAGMMSAERVVTWAE